MTRRIKRAAIILAITILSIQQSALPVFANENNPPLPEDNIVIPEIFYATASSTVSEDAGEHTVTVRLSEPTTEEVRFTPTVVSDHVTDGVEFIFASQDVEQTIPAGETEKTLTISFIDDEEKEEDKTLVLGLLDTVVGATVSETEPTQHVITITDNDIAVPQVITGAKISFTSAEPYYSGTTL